MSSRTPTMSRPDREKRRQRILGLLHAGKHPSVVARSEGLTADHVRQIGLNGGLRVMPVEERPSSIWDLSEADRREEFARRAARGARTTLRALGA